ncbi:hypothetical protein M8J77_011720 [Diaphorina citri]|nr:hypothetical protein M8J77_011720 [Diaphorina citri]
MAVPGVPLPTLKYDELNIRNIKDFKRKFECYLEANKLTTETSQIQLAHFRSSLDLETDELTQSFKIPNPKYEQLLEALERHFEPKKNIIMAQFKFFSQVQQHDETFQNFYAKLRKLAKDCEFGEQEGNIMKSRIILGVKDRELQQRLLRNSEDRLDDIVNHCKGAEEALTNQQQIRHENNKEKYEVTRIQARTRPSHQVESQLKVQSQFKCKRCGKNHPPKSCPAFHTTCTKCKRKGHYPALCKTRRHKHKVNCVENSSDEENSDF